MKRRIAVLLCATVAFAMIAGAASAAPVDSPIGQPFLGTLGWWKLGTNGANATINNWNGAPGLGTHSVDLSSGATGGQIFLSTELLVLPGLTAVSSLQELGYWTFSFPESYRLTPTLQIAVDLDGLAPNWDTTLVFEPSFNGIIEYQTWQHWDTLAGKWYSTQTIPGGFDQNHPDTLAAILAANPAATVSLIPSDPGGSIRLQFGSTGAGYGGYHALADGFTIKAKNLPRYSTSFESITDGLLPL
jgi:opacity protein-like surface antigen